MNNRPSSLYCKNNKLINSMRIAIIGAGNAGQALAGTLANQGHEVYLYNRNINHLSPLIKNKLINCFGALSAKGEVAGLTNNIAEALKGADLIFVTTTADAHKNIASLIAKHLEDSQIIFLCPGRTGGAFEFRQVLNSRGCYSKVYIAELQTLLYACRAVMPGEVNIIGVKDCVSVAAFPTADTDYVMGKIKQLHPAYVKAKNVLETSFQNIGAILHPAVMLFNAAAIERGTKFFFYQDMTPTIVDFIIQLDEERLALGEAYGLKLLSVIDWSLKAYPNSRCETLCDHLKCNPAYYDILAPDSLNSRYLLEDIPTGLVPFISFGKLVGLEMPLTKSLIQISSAIFKCNFFRDGRTLDSMGLAGKTPDEILKLL